MIEISNAHQILLDAGFTSGWAISGEELILWEHEQDPPAPLKRPAESTTNDTE